MREWGKKPKKKRASADLSQSAKWLFEQRILLYHDIVMDFTPKFLLEIN